MMMSRERLVKITCLALFFAILYPVLHVCAQRPSGRVELSNVVVTPIRSTGGYKYYRITGDVRALGITKGKFRSWDMVFVDVEFLKSGQQWLLLRESSGWYVGEEWVHCELGAIGHVCLTAEEAHEFGRSAGIAHWFLAEEDEGRWFHFDYEAVMRPEAEQFRVRAVLRLVPNAYGEHYYYWDLSPVYDAVSGPEGLSVELVFTPQRPTPEDTVSLTASRISGARYEWFRDGRSVDEGVDAYNHKWDRPAEGEHSVVVKVVDEQGRSGQALVTFVVAPNTAPVVSKLEYSPAEPTTNDLIRFRATAADPDGDELTFNWYVDGEHVDVEKSGTLQRKLSAGEHHVRVVVSDGRGGSAEARVGLDVGAAENHEPTVRLVASLARPRFDEAVRVDAIAQDPDGDELEFEWFDLRRGLNLTADEGLAKTVSGIEMEVTERGRRDLTDDLLRELHVKVYDRKGGVAQASISVQFERPEPILRLEVTDGQAAVNLVYLDAGARWFIQDGDLVEAPPDGHARLIHADGSTFDLRPGTEVTIAADGRIIVLDHGGLWNRVVRGAKGQRFQVRTPAATGTVNGTDFEVLAEAGGRTTFRVFEGQLDVTDSKSTKTVTLEAEQTSSCEVGGVPSEPEPFDLASVDAWWEESGPDEPQPQEQTTSAPERLVRSLVLSLAESTAPSGQTVKVPVRLEGADNLQLLSFDLLYDPAVLRVSEVTPGELGAGAAVTADTATSGRVHISVVSGSGIDGTGTITQVAFRVLGKPGQSCTLALENARATDIGSKEPVEFRISTHNGRFTVQPGSQAADDGDIEVPRSFYALLCAACLVPLAGALLLICLFVRRRRRTQRS